MYTGKVEYFQDREYVYLHAPLITASDAEGAGEMFQVTTLDLDDVPKDNGRVDYSKDFFGRRSSLTVSGQLQAETFALAFRKTYTFGPTFRAEESNTKNHASEFWMVEPEIAFCDLKEDMDIMEDMLNSGFAQDINVYIGQENEKDELKDFSVVTFKHKVGNKDLGTIGIIGPKRMDYSKVISVMKYISKKLNDNN